MRIVLVALISIGVGAGALAGVVAWQPWSNGDEAERAASATPTQEATPDGPGLTGEEAALKAQAWSRDRIVDTVLCQAGDFDEQADAWNTSCTFESQGISLTGDPPNPQTCTFRLWVNNDGLVIIVEQQPSNAERPLWVCE